MRTTDQLIGQAQTGFEAGFATKAAKKRALDALNTAYYNIRNDAHGALVDHVNATWPWNDRGIRTDEDWARAAAVYAAFDFPFDLHNVRPYDIANLERFGVPAGVLQTLIDLRQAIKDADFLPLADRKVDPRVELVQRTVAEELKRRQTLYLEALDLGRLFGGLPVTVNAHWVRPIKAVDHIRHFYYLNGKLTPLLVILAAAQKLEQERKDQAA